MSMKDTILTAKPGHDNRVKTFALDSDVWSRAVRLVEATGYRGNFFAGLDRSTTKHFSSCLRQVLEQGRARSDDLPALNALVGFLDGPGAGGTRLTTGFKRWNRA